MLDFLLVWLFGGDMFPPKIERVGGTLISLHRWGGHVGGTDFRLGGIFSLSVPPYWGGKEELCLQYLNFSLKPQRMETWKL